MPLTPSRLGTLDVAQGCLTKLGDIRFHEEGQLEQLIGFNRGRLSSGFYLLLLVDPLRTGDFAFFGYTYMSDGRVGLPSRDPAIEQGRPAVQALLAGKVGPLGLKNLQNAFANALPLKGPARYVKVVPVIRHDEHMVGADQYPASPFGIPQLKLLTPKNFFVAALVRNGIWTLANGTTVDIAEKPDYTRPYGTDPRARASHYLEQAP